MPKLRDGDLLVAMRRILLWTLFPGLSIASPVLIHHPQLTNEDFSTSSLVRIYAMQKRVWSDSTPIKVFTLSNTSALHKDFVHKYLRMQPYQLDRLWHRLVFSGTGTTPVEVFSIEEMIEKVKNTPGAVGYVDSTDADGIDKSMMTVTTDD